MAKFRVLGKLGSLTVMDAPVQWRVRHPRCRRFARGCFDNLSLTVEMGGHPSASLGTGSGRP